MSTPDYTPPHAQALFAESLRETTGTPVCIQSQADRELAAAETAATGLMIGVAVIILFLMTLFPED